jgi:hypothetical protein
MGCHDTCKTNDDTYKYFCKGVKEREENLFDLFMQCSIFDEFLAAINRLARNASSCYKTLIQIRQNASTALSTN